MLEDVLIICHRAVISPPLAREYDQHASKYGVRWLKAMTTKGKVVTTEAKETKRARRWLQSPELRSASQRAELAKDMHLVMAALETDEVIISAERLSRDLLARAVSDTDYTPGWVVIDDDTPPWLARGAVLKPQLRVVRATPPATRSKKRR